jgi:UDP-glucose:(heptosyl)LPS alpha-1,3-glucosyltransferase
VFSQRSAAWIRRAQSRFDIVHAFSRTRHQHVYRAGGGCHAVFMQQTHTRTGAALRRLSPRHALLLAIEARVFEDARQTIHCPSRRVRDEIVRRHPAVVSRSVVIPNGVDPDLYHPERHQAEARSLRAGLDPDAERVWLFAGSGGRRKGLDTALRALAACRHAGDVLWVAGRIEPGPARRLAAELGVESRVRLLGPRNDLPVLYAASDGLLLPTRYDPFANVSLEAAASGRPVLTSATNGAADLLAEAAIVVADAEDWRAFAAGLDRLADPDLRDRLGRKGREIACRNDWDAHARSLQALYRDLVSRTGDGDRGAAA